MFADLQKSSWKTTCLSSLHTWHITLPTRWLRSSNGTSLSVPRVETDADGRAFYSYSLSLWNSLPLSVCCNLQEASQNTSLRLSLFARDTSTPDGALMLWNCFVNVAVEPHSAITPLSLAMPAILPLYKFDLIDWCITFSNIIQSQVIQQYFVQILRW